jgi:hypothetical protein
MVTKEQNPGVYGKAVEFPGALPLWSEIAAEMNGE